MCVLLSKLKSNYARKPRPKSEGHSGVVETRTRTGTRTRKTPFRATVVVVVGCVRKINFVRKLPREREKERKAVKRDTETEIEEKGLKHNPMTFWPRDKRIKEPMLSWLIAQIQAGTRIQP